MNKAMNKPTLERNKRGVGTAPQLMVFIFDSQGFRSIQQTGGVVTFPILFQENDNTSQPTAVASYLAAATLFSAISQHNVIGSTYLPAGKFIKKHNTG